MTPECEMCGGSGVDFDARGNTRPCPCTAEGKKVLASQMVIALSGGLANSLDMALLRAHRRIEQGAEFVFVQDPNQGNMMEEEKQALLSDERISSFVDVLRRTANQAPREAGLRDPLPHVPTGTPLELAPRRDFESTDFIPAHVLRTKSVSVVMLKSGRWGVARVRTVSDPLTRNAQGAPEFGTSNLSSGYVHTGEPLATRAEAEKAAYALAHKLGLAADGWA